ncbi:MAG: anthranilate synthase component I family protein [Actinobacteria bacterium]|nr:anthranilate synthase component I family protein [Actinomycetota bacterium]
MGGVMASEIVEISNDPSVLSDGNFWALTATFEGELTLVRFKNVRKEEFPNYEWAGSSLNKWETTINKEQYCEYVETIREAIAAGDVYQVNACREIFHQGVGLSLAGLFGRLISNNPAPFASFLSIPGLEIASASPELFLKRDGRQLKSSPIKGTKKLNSEAFGEKDKSENIMIVDLMRNDLGRICTPGSVDVQNLLRTENHPGLTHLVSDVLGELKDGLTWKEILAATLPPGSVSGAPKSSALDLISKSEKNKRSTYCGALGWIHGDQALLSVAIRTFWKKNDDILRFGTGAGITWGSDPLSEWEETELKARKLISIAEGHR